MAATPASAEKKGLSVPGTGVGAIYLAKLKVEVPTVERVQGETKFKIPTMGELQDKFKDDPAMSAQLRNKVKVCAECKKPCAHTLKCCNSCGASLESVAVSYTENVFMGFCYGVGKGARFPFSISVRYEDENYLCFDDPLSVSPLHLNCIPTTVYIPDLRFLFLNPTEGLKIVNSLFRHAAEAARTQFWSRADFRKKFFHDEPQPLDAERLIDIAFCGMNCPPSQYQLHLQFIHPPLLPFHYAQFKDGGHFHHNRFFPLEYLRLALAKGDAVKMAITEETDVMDIIKKCGGVGVSYDKVIMTFYERINRVQARFSPWIESDFDREVVNGAVHDAKTLSFIAGESASDIQKEDTRLLQNYGRPYNDAGKPTGGYYKFPKEPKSVRSFV